MNENILEFLTTEGLSMAMAWSTKIFYAAIALLLGLWVIKLLRRLIHRSIGRVLKEDDLVGFLVSTANVLMKVVLLVAIASMLGIQTASFLAVLGSIGLAIGLALQGSLANFAGGILLLIFKPFKKGDFVTIKETDGFVERIDILYTSLRTRLNRIVTIPNSTITSDVLINHHHEEMVRRMWYLKISHDSDLLYAKELVYRAIDETPRISKEKKPFVEVSNLTEDAIEFRIFIWVRPEDYFMSKEPAIENIKLMWDKHGIKMPLPKRVVHFTENGKVAVLPK